MKIEIEGKNQTKKELWVDGYYVGKIDICEELEPLIDADEYVLEEEVTKVLEVCPEPFKSQLKTLLNNIKVQLKTGEFLTPTINYTIERLKCGENDEEIGYYEY